ncbi:MAG: hypothetical protein HKP58_01690 [Desulfatitalea sp.]|nr:cysteine rich repeat-containing protein [Desulfatitalea sp.]NNJ99099.1 hypothetical protein [Desulfatitalea sp.]
MKSGKSFGIILCLLLLAATPVGAEQALLKSVAQGCKAELESYCKKVTPGDGRVLACLYAYGDKLSGQCEYALYDAAIQLERFVASLAYVANECGNDLDQYCNDAGIGQGRLLKCLEKNNKKVSQRCKQALKDVGVKQ